MSHVVLIDEGPFGETPKRRGKLWTDGDSLKCCERLDCACTTKKFDALLSQCQREALVGASACQQFGGGWLINDQIAGQQHRGFLEERIGRRQGILGPR